MTALQTPISKAKENQRNFIGYLISLGKQGREDRGALADLRSGLGKEPGHMARVHRHVVPFLPHEAWNDHWYYLAATLFGSYPTQSRGQTMGKAFRALRQKSESMDKRFVALLNAHADDLGDYLRQAVSVLKSNDRPLDWFKLLDDLLQWDHPGGQIQLRWARDFYAGGVDPSNCQDNEHEGGKGEDDNEP